MCSENRATFNDQINLFLLSILGTSITIAMLYLNCYGFVKVTDYHVHLIMESITCKNATFLMSYFAKDELKSMKIS